MKELAFFPGMDLTTAAKVEFVEDVLRRLTATHDVVTLEEHARAVGAAPTSVVRRMREERALG